MKRIFTILLSGLFITIVFLPQTIAQTPEKMSYQAVIRDASDNLMVNHSVGMQISILQSSITGTAVYVERHFPTTNANGLVTMKIGDGTAISGEFNTIEWGNDLYFIKTETDLNGGDNYTITGTSQLLSVPYALHAKTAESYIEADPFYGASVASGIEVVDTTNWNNKLDIEIDGSVTNEIQTLSIVDSDLTLSPGGGTVVIPGSSSPWNQEADSIYTFDNVGVGTQSATHKLTLEGTSVGTNGRKFLLMNNKSVDGYSAAGLAIKAGINNTFTLLQHFSSTYANPERANFSIWYANGSGMLIEAADPKGIIKFSTNHDGINGIERMRITDNGDVGIGTDNPSTKLDVNGGIKVGSSGLIMNELIELKGSTEPTGDRTIIPLPDGWTSDNTRILSAELKNKNDTYWNGLGAATGDFEFSYHLDPTEIIIYYVDIAHFHSAPYRIVMIRVE